jgi:H+/Cl- antiporter ClcA
MWQRGLNWAAILLVGTFGLMWVGVVVYADHSSAPWMRVVQIVFGLFLLGWAVQKAATMVTRDQGWKR